MTSTLSRPGRYWRSVSEDLASRPFGWLLVLRWLAMYVLGRIVFVRAAPRWTPRARPADSRDATSIFDVSASEIAQIVEALRADGFDARLRLPAPIVRELVSSGGSGLAPDAPYARAGPGSTLLPATIAEDPVIRQIAGSYLLTAPIFQGSRMWWTRQGENGDPLQTGARFHFDLYDYRSLTFLFYLTDVDADTAPHVCVRASHRSRRWRDQLHPRRHRSDEWIARLYGEDRVVTIPGPAGTGIAEDPFCFHKVGLSTVRLPARGERLALQLLFTGRDFPAPSFHRDPPARPGAAARSRDRG